MSLSATPWNVGENGDVYSVEDFCVASCWSEEDAKLIAAAPRLLEFAKRVVEYAKESSNTYLSAWAQSVVNQAEKES